MNCLTQYWALNCRVELSRLDLVTLLNAGKGGMYVLRIEILLGEQKGKIISFNEYCCYGPEMVKIYLSNQ